MLFCGQIFTGQTASVSREGTILFSHLHVKQLTPNTAQSAWFPPCLGVEAAQSGKGKSRDKAFTLLDPTAPWPSQGAVLSRFSHVRLFATPWTVVCLAPLSMEILQARILECVAMPSSRGLSQPKDRTQGWNPGVPHCPGCPWRP